MSRSGSAPTAMSRAATARSAGWSPSRATTALDILRARKPVATISTRRSTLPTPDPTLNRRRSTAASARASRAASPQLEPDRADAVRGAYLDGYQLRGAGGALQRAAQHDANLAAPQPVETERVPDAHEHRGRTSAETERRATASSSPSTRSACSMRPSTTRVARLIAADPALRAELQHVAQPPPEPRRRVRRAARAGIGLGRDRGAACSARRQAGDRFWDSLALWRGARRRRARRRGRRHRRQRHATRRAEPRGVRRRSSSPRSRRRKAAASSSSPSTTRRPAR